MKPKTTYPLLSLLWRSTIAVLLLFCLTSCAYDITDDWKTLQLTPDGWTIKAPEGSSSKFNPAAHFNQLRCNGFILYFKNHHIKDNPQSPEISPCTSDKKYAAFQGIIASGGRTTLYGKHTPHYTYIDTVDNNVALMTAPVGAHGGNVSISVTDCRIPARMFITGDDLSAEQVALVKAMFKTLRYTGE